MNSIYSVLMIGVISLVTIALRFIPFLILGKKKTPQYIQYLGNILPYAIIGMLVVYCFKDISFVAKPYAVPEVLAVGLIVLSYWWKRNTLISFLVGTVGYMALIQIM